MLRLIVLLIGIMIGYALGRERRAPATIPIQKTAPTPAAKPPDQPDDLTTINGIGPSFAQALNNAGIRTFAQLAAQDPDDLAQRLGVRITAERIRRDGWIEQARAKSGNE